MDPNPKSHPVLSYVLSRTPSFGGSGRHAAAVHVDIEKPAPSSSPTKQIVNQMPHLTHPNVIASMASAVTDVAQTRAVLKRLGTRPDHETVDNARAKIAEIDSDLVKKLEDIVLSPRPTSEARVDWRARLEEKEKAFREEAEKQKSEYKAVISLEEMHVAYDRLLKAAEERLVGLYDTAAREKEEEGERSGMEEVNEEVVGVLKKGLGTGGVLDRVDLSGSRLRILPEAFGKIHSLVTVNLSNNQLEELPDSIGGLQNLEELNLYSNLLETLPESIGLLHNLKILNVSGNKLIVLPDSISHCRSLVELDVSFNNLTYLPTNLGCELSALQKLSIQLNKIRSLPTSICEMRSLRYLDAHFNELRGLPPHFGKLTNLETLNLASNFADLRELPITFGNLTNLKELDLSNNQIHALPYTFGCLANLVKLNVEQNPIVVPPVEVVQQGVEAVSVFMGKKWIEVLEEEEKEGGKEEGEEGWVSRGAKWLTRTVSNVSDSVTGYLGSPKSPKDHYLDQRM